MLVPEPLVMAQLVWSRPPDPRPEPRLIVPVLAAFCASWNNAPAEEKFSTPLPLMFRLPVAEAPLPSPTRTAVADGKGAAGEIDDPVIAVADVEFD